MVRLGTAMAVLAKQRDDAIYANQQWQAACASRDQTIAELRTANAQLHTQLDRPSVAMDQLHPIIAANASELYQHGRSDDAVRRALIAVENEIRRRSGADATHFGTQLVGEAMGGNNPTLRFSEHQGEQEGVHSLFRGAMGWFRNTVMHRLDTMNDPIAAFETLAFASRLMHMLDAAENSTNV